VIKKSIYPKFKKMKIKNLLFAALTGSLLFNACKKDVSAHNWRKSSEH
jgi:hypothetical protein